MFAECNIICMLYMITVKYIATLIDYNRRVYMQDLN